MSADGFRADHELLVDRARRFEDLAGRADAIAARLADALAATGACWGGDEIGRGFAAAHEGPASDAVARLGALGGRLGEVAARFAATARDYRAAEDAALDGARAIGHGS
ncbi:hypothetical protein LX15_004150 [Streptoalloteichus tenebrarius]|uniref:WXG100 family type VII secretion target n=1 Tax=Streptoalloteichus tenebrarius (strain ATCC 17920 / DSM 40477 / JCM 4838 / CBS 697.72 / NBRC 16177 / NCIMB 11028 / NRRL B-12390 / A12253. 1 / ISP 5477) TaxID=1933 RepID=A0ABT1HY35_STRSD|nr:hypothetical protein [Streptoalloteichus tenebrarius]MCP2260432.1 hypothetical protein [Streptoalloteichus tenebrarius]BFF02773.1 hypothetical protein GCM10020241_44480 [Streptoalloteichus tenebrarius]